MSLPLLDLGPLLELDPASSPDLTVELAPADVPLALLPARLEARFASRAGGLAELLVRVYPDKLHLDAHDPRLSPVEAAAGAAYWRDAWRAGADEARQRTAWRGLTDRFGPGRAAWIARRLEPANDRQDAEPVLPDPGPLTERTATPVARLLPDSWTASAYTRGQLVATVTGSDLRPDLAIGPNLDVPLHPLPDGPDLDEGMAWMIDFAEAERAGMALRLPLDSTMVDAQVDLLLVSGVRSADPAEGAQAYADLLAAQRYTDGIAFVSPGTPSNNSLEDRSGYLSRDLRGEQSFGLEWREPVATPASNAGRSAAALGLVDHDLERLAGSGDDHASLPAAVVEALWPATWGYYLTQFTGLGARRPLLADRDWVRDFAASWIRPGGPLPAIRVGRQPYGLLPVTSLSRFASDGPDAGRAGRLRDLLATLRDLVWRPALADVTRIGRSSDPNADLVDVLRTDATAGGYGLRRAMGPQYVQHLQKFLGVDLEAVGFWTRLQQLTGALPARVGLGFTPSMGGLIWEPNNRPVILPMLPDDHAAMVDELLAADLAALTARPPGSVLEALLRFGLLREHAALAAQLLTDDDNPLAFLLRDFELVDLGPAPVATPSFSWQLAQPVPGATDTVRSRLDATPSVLRDALAAIAAAPEQQLDRVVRETLGIAGHRLDSWVTAFATHRLADLRSANPTGLRVGGYGWLENLRPEPRTSIDPLPDEPGPLTAAVDDPGFIHAASLGQAAAAALLRNAHLAHGGTSDGAYAVNLTSARVRQAIRLFDGVRQGQSLGDLLGYDVERQVHDSQLDHLLDDLRRAAPPPRAEDGDDAARRRVLLDGLELHRQDDANRDQLLSTIKGMSSEDRTRLIMILDRLAAALDAAADAVTAENVFQFACGNLTRSGGSLDEIATGKAPPPSLEFMRTPRTGTAITHRVAVAVAAEGDRTAGWANDTPRAQAEPALDAWLSRLLGPADGVELVVEVLGGGSALDRHQVPLPALGLAAVDLVCIAGDAAGPTELARRAFAVSGDGGAEPALRLDLSPSADRSRRGISDLLELAGRARAVLAAGRPLDGADLQPAHAAPERGLDLDDFEARATAAEVRLRALHDQLDQLLALDPPPTLGQVTAVLVRLAGYGVTGALTPIGAETDRLLAGSAAVPAVTAVLTETARRLAEAAGQSPVGGEADETDEARRDRVLRRFRAVFGSGFLACPRFRAATATDLRSSLDDAALLADDPLAAYTWWQRMERIRPPLARVGLVLREAEILGGAVTLDLAVTQVPHVAGRPWSGARLEPAAEGQDGQVSLVLAGSDTRDLTGPLAGVLVDEWTEVVPSRTETTGIAFRFDPPDAVAPHAVLLAVPPVAGEPWTVGTLQHVLLETLDLAHLRTVGPELLDAAAQYLPATLLSFNVAGDVPSTDPTVLTG